jgi:hypothetical protein
LLFAPTAYEACELALPANTPCREEISKYAISLGITNIRILRKIFNLTEIIYNDVSKLHVGVMKQAVMTLVLLIWCYYDSDETKPSIEFIIKWNRMAWGFNEGKGKEKDPTHTAWANMLRDYGLTHMDEFDQTIIKVIQRGYLEETGFSEEAMKLDAILRANELEQSFTQAWRLFHDTFSDNQAELIKALAESFKKSVQHISLINLNGTVHLLRQLGSSDIADELIDVFVCNHANEAKLFDLTDYPFADDITDPVILERFKEQHSKYEATLPLIEAVKYIATNNGFSIEHTNALKKATEDDFFKLFKLEHGELFGGMVKSCPNLNVGATKTNL